MATFKTCVFEHQKRQDAKYPISIRITNNRSSAYISTGVYIVRTQISRDFSTIKDTAVARSIDKQVQIYENIIVDKLGASVKLYSAKELCEFLVKSTATIDFIDFIAFAREHISTISSPAYAKKMEAPINALLDYHKKETLNIRAITSKFLLSFSKFLQSERTIKRLNRSKKEIFTTHPPVSDRTLADYMTVIRTLFNAAVNKYNDEDLGVIAIPNYPFKKFKIQSSFHTRKRSLNIDTLKKVRDYDAKTSRRIELAKDVFMLSFYLVGINLVDLFTVTDSKKGRISYNRCKTQGRREDSAYISIRIEPEAQIIIDKYRDTTGKRVFSFYAQYGRHQEFVRAVNVGLKHISQDLELEDSITSYYARHSWATIARNTCRVPLEDINLALNHVDGSMKITDIYITKDFSLIDEANRKVLDYLLQQ